MLFLTWLDHNFFEENVVMYIEFDSTKQGIVHPEQRSNEVFIGNFDPHAIDKCVSWKTKRIGIAAYREDGSLYPETLRQEYRPVPVFAERNEVLEAHYALIYG